MLKIPDAFVHLLLLLNLVVFLSVPVQNSGLDVLQVLLVLLSQVFFFHLLQEIRLILCFELLETHLLEVLGLKEMPVHLLLLSARPLRIVVTSSFLHGLNILLQLLHELRLPLQALLHLLCPLLLLLVHEPVVLPHRLSLTLHVRFPLVITLLLISQVFLEDLAHGSFRLLLLTLKAPLLSLHFIHNLLHKHGLLVLFLLEFFGLQFPLVAQLVIPVLLFPHELVMPFLLAGLFSGLPPLKLDHGIVVIPQLFMLALLPSFLLLSHLGVQVAAQLPLKRLDANLLPQGILLVKVRGVLVQLGPVKGFGLAVALDDVHPCQRSHAAAPLAHAAVCRHTGDCVICSLPHRLVLEPPLEAAEVCLGDIG
mmetsp:Transcript_10551/g.24799  ORF Transcript_10551/g.24799 Transcript_10551/m.24799 type:complete len:366 (+) Transcript_10551:394-1491(+)